MEIVKKMLMSAPPHHYFTANFFSIFLAPLLFCSQVLNYNLCLELEYLCWWLYQCLKLASSMTPCIKYLTDRICINCLTQCLCDATCATLKSDKTSCFIGTQCSTICWETVVVQFVGPPCRPISNLRLFSWKDLLLCGGKTWSIVQLHLASLINWPVN